jgi:hypothetical protein
MQKFSQFITEAKEGKNLHLEHLEDEILNKGLKGGASAIELLTQLKTMFSGDSYKPVNITVKWDGAPAVFFGKDPADGKFFVGTKGVFNKNPKLNKSDADIMSNHSGELAEKLKVALATLSKLSTGDKVYQGDMMFTSGDVASQKIDGEDYLTFQPNTLMYAVQKDSDLGKEISNAKMGIVVHTVYTGDALADMNASFNLNVRELGNAPGLWLSDAEYRDTSGTATFTASETKEVEKAIAAAERAFKKINKSQFNTFYKMQMTLMGSSGTSGSSFKTFMNSHFRKGENINAKTASKEYTKYLQDWWQKQIDKVKTEKAKANKSALRDEIVKTVAPFEGNTTNIAEFYNAVMQAKILIVRKLEKVKQMTKTFKRTDNGYEVTEPEGFVAVDKISGNAVKLVDRLEFAYLNFNLDKNWDKTK